MKANSLRIFAVIVLLCVSAGAIVQNYKLKERIVRLEPRVTKLEPRVTNVERTVLVPRKSGSVIVRPRVIKRTVIQRRTTHPVVKVVNRPVPGPQGPVGPAGPKGDTGTTGARGPSGLVGTVPPTLVTTVDNLKTLTDKLQKDLENLGITVNKELLALGIRINGLLCSVLPCVQP